MRERLNCNNYNTRIHKQGTQSPIWLWPRFGKGKEREDSQHKNVSYGEDCMLCKEEKRKKGYLVNLLVGLCTNTDVAFLQNLSNVGTVT